MDHEEKIEIINDTKEKVRTINAEINYKNAERERYKIEQAEIRKSLYLAFTFFVAFSIIASAVVVNIDIFKLEQETSIIINQAINAVVLLAIPFLLGSVAGLTRILMSDVSVKNKGTLVVSSGIMAMFSWIGIKSGVLMAIVAPHLEKQGVVVALEGQTSSTFYTMALVAILVGMFSTNLYLFINGRVEQLTAKNQPIKTSEKKGL
ncbi:hypothetical protein ACSZNF_13525 [Aeromonas hydrophila]